MTDTYGRMIDYMRISITDRCNLRCVYCMPPDGVPFLAHEELLSFEEMISICRCGAALGLRHIKITGGEPLVRKGVDSLIGSLKQIEGIETVTLTTNGILLPEYMERLSAAGVNGINISLDTLDREWYRQITRGGSVKEVLKGLYEALQYPDIVTKINCVLEGDHWREHAAAVAGLAKDHPVHVRFIERMPLGMDDAGCTQEESVVSLLEAEYGAMKSYRGQLGYGPSKYFTVEGFQGKIGFISAVSHKFCHGCNRIRLTSTGKLRLCLQSQEGVDLRELLRSGSTDEEIIACFLETIVKKPKEHQFDRQDIEAAGMSQIGG